MRERILGEVRRAYAHGFGHRHPWDRVFNEAIGRRPGWHQRIRWELRLHYGAHLHRRLFLWFGAAIFLAVVTTLVAAHFGRGGLASRPVRALFMFGAPAALLWIGAGRVARRIARPLYHLTRAAQDLGAGNLKVRVSAENLGFDELAVLAYAFNEMAARLERQLADERELLASVSHELRTPLSRIRLLVEIARQAQASAGPDPHTLDEIEREAIEIDTLVGELLASARIEFQAVSCRPLEAGEIARRALERGGEDPGKLSVTPATIGFAADPTLVARALANLLDNARKHGGGLDRMEVRAGAEGRSVIFEISDRGRGFVPGEEARVFDRFFRGTGTGPQGSLGLGLALVKRIAEAHGGRAQAENRPGGGARITLELPLEPAVNTAGNPG
ncbi:MAG TPA: HAMP domain-containing sensor histidine kinase [Polyangia bacterium]|nr:HAMP domain-containing sensor histidine kinase [Polyangia bacterium]